MLQFCIRFDYNAITENTTIENFTVLSDRAVLSNNRKLYDGIVFYFDTVEQVRMFYGDIVADCAVFSYNTFEYVGFTAQIRARCYHSVVAHLTGEGQLHVVTEINVTVPEAVLVDYLWDLRISPSVQNVVGDFLIGRPVKYFVDVAIVDDVDVERAVQDFLVDQQPLDEVVFGLEVEVVGEQRWHGRGTDGDVGLGQVPPYLDRTVDHQFQGQVDFASALVVVQHAPRLGVQHQRLPGVRVALLIDERHHSPPVPFLPEVLEPVHERQQGKLADHIAPEQHEIVSDQGAGVQVAEDVAERTARVRAGVDEIQPVETGVLDECPDAVGAATAAEQHHVHDAGRVQQVQRVVEQRLVHQRHQARVVSFGGGPEVLVEEAGHDDGLQDVLFLHFRGLAHGADGSTDERTKTTNYSARQCTSSFRSVDRRTWRARADNVEITSNDKVA